VHPDEAIAAGQTNVGALLIGTNRDEFRLFTVGQRHLADLDEAGLEELVGAYVPTGVPLDAPGLVEAYRAAAARRGEERTRRDLFEMIAGEALFRIPALRLATRHAELAPTYCYRFDWESPFAGLGLGACHGLELPFVFGTVANPVIGLFSGSTPEALALSEAMQNAWTQFASTGDPGVGATAPWPLYDATDRRTLVLGPEIHLETAPGEEERLYWEDRLGRYGVAGEPGRDRLTGT
jgi:para-nitrobenzyl esterase